MPDALIGKRWSPVEYEVGREKVREYASAVGETNPLHYDPAVARSSGFRNLLAPPMFCAVYCAPAMARAAFEPVLGIDRARLVHGEQSFEWLTAVCAGDTIATTCELADVYVKAGNAFYVFVSTSRNQDGEETLRARYTGIVRGPKSGSADGPPVRRDGGAGSDQQGGIELDTPSPEPATPGEISAGSVLPEFRETPDRYLPYRYAGASGDFTPIHIDAEFARAAGLPGIILHGLYTMALLARAQIEAARGDPRALRALRVQFRGIAVPESEIVVRSRVKSIEDGAAVVEAVALQEDREIVRNAEATVSMRVS